MAESYTTKPANTIPKQHNLQPASPVAQPNFKVNNKSFNYLKKGFLSLQFAGEFDSNVDTTKRARCPPCCYVTALQKLKSAPADWFEGEARSGRISHNTTRDNLDTSACSLSVCSSPTWRLDKGFHVESSPVINSFIQPLGTVMASFRLELCSILFVLLFEVSFGYFITIDAHAEECFHDQVTSGTKMGLIFEVAEGGFLDIDVTVNNTFRASKGSSIKYS